jgi:hypothetical protein
MAIFSNKIISAKFINNLNSIVEVLYTEGENIIPFIIEVDYTNEDFKSLLEEYPLEKIELETQEIRKKEVETFNSLVEARVNQKLQNGENEKQFTTKDMFSFMEQNATDTDFIFEFKVSVLEDEQVAAIKDKTLKAKIRKSKNFYELLSIYGDIKSKG